MKIEKVFCRELGRTVDIQEAGISYFAQTPPRTKYSFYCSSPQCLSLPHKVEVLGINYHRVPLQADESIPLDISDRATQDAPRVSPYFRTKKGFTHSLNCQWVIDKEAEEEYVSEGQTSEIKRRRRQRIASDGLIEESSFLVNQSASSHSEVDIEEVDEAIFETNEKGQRKTRINRAKDKLKQPKRSPYFSALVSSYVKVLENKLYDEPLNVISLGDTTWGSFFYPIEWYTEENHRNHVFKGNVRIMTLPRNHDWSNGDPNAVILTFYDEVTVGETRAKPSVKLLKRDIENSLGSYVLFEAVKSAQQNDNYKNYLRCYFYGSIIEATKQAKTQTDENGEADKVLNVKVMRLDTLELRRIDI